MKLDLNELMRIFATVFGGAVSGGILVYGLIKNAPSLITIGCVSFVIQMICNYFIRR